jgi:hypothetical protein
MKTKTRKTMLPTTMMMMTMIRLESWRKGGIIDFDVLICHVRDVVFVVPKQHGYNLM